MKFIKIPSYMGIVLFALALGSCDKNKPYEITIPPAAVHFVGEETQVYAVESSATGPFDVVIGTTDVSSQDRTVTYTVTSKTGAVQGSQYTLTPAGTVTIPKGQATAKITLQGNSNFYPAGKVDTLEFSLSEPGIKVASFSDHLTLIVKGPCSDADVNLPDMAGNFKETDPSGTYSVKVSNLVATSATTGTGVITNLWGDIAPVTINFDWSDPSNITVSIPRQQVGYDYDDGMPMSIRTSPGVKSTFSICNQTISLVTDLLIENYFGPGEAALYKGKYPMNCKR